MANQTAPAKAKDKKVNKNMKIIKCNGARCDSLYQDSLYQGKRAMNPTMKKALYRCTVCGNENNSGEKDEEVVQ